MKSNEERVESILQKAAEKTKMRNKRVHTAVFTAMCVVCVSLTALTVGIKTEVIPLLSANHPGSHGVVSEQTGAICSENTAPSVTDKTAQNVSETSSVIASQSETNARPIVNEPQQETEYIPETEPPTVTAAPTAEPTAAPTTDPVSEINKFIPDFVEVIPDSYVEELAEYANKNIFDPNTTQPGPAATSPYPTWNFDVPLGGAACPTDPSAPVTDVMTTDTNSELSGLLGSVSPEALGVNIFCSESFAELFTSSADGVFRAKVYIFSDDPQKVYSTLRENTVSCICSGDSYIVFITSDQFEELKNMPLSALSVLLFVPA